MVDAYKDLGIPLNPPLQTQKIESDANLNFIGVP